MGHSPDPEQKTRRLRDRHRVIINLIIVTAYGHGLKMGNSIANDPDLRHFALVVFPSEATCKEALQCDVSFTHL